MRKYGGIEMRILILGSDGYLGWPLSLHFANKGRQIYGIDDLSRRKRVMERGSDSGIPIASPEERKKIAKEILGVDIDQRIFDLRNTQKVMETIKEIKPEVIVHFGEIPSAPYSMRDVYSTIETHDVNVNGTLNVIWTMQKYCPQAHLIKLGTMGEYGVPGITISEGYIKSINGEEIPKRNKVLFPRDAGSFYHQTKVHDTNNIKFACKIWGLRSTDIMQGVVYGTRTEQTAKNPLLATRFDFDSIWGTAVNRFVVQAILGIPLTVYGLGGQTRGYLNIIDTMRCIETIAEHPPEEGEYRTINQFTQVKSITEIAELVQKVGNKIGLDVEIKNIPNPRIEAERHKYPVEQNALRNMGFERSKTMEESIRYMIEDLLPYKERLRRFVNSVMPYIKWNPKVKT
jgi:nucleoside-diphosphate-sugar epimerase